MKKIIPIVLLLLASSCTQNQRAKNYGGIAEIELEKGQKLVDVTWKDTDIWYLTKPMTSKDSAETYMFQEESTYGLIQGKVIFIESK